MKKHPKNPKSNSGFTFIELSIVLAIVGILAGALLVGREMLRGGELRTIMSDLARYEAAVVTFRDKYQNLPGDFPTATTTWGSLGGSGSDALCQNTTANGIATCNGNGDGVIRTSVVTFDETARAWQHLKNAQLVEGNFTGTTNGMTMAYLLEKTFPPAKKGEMGYQFFTEDRTSEGWTTSNPTDALEAAKVLPSIRLAAPTAPSVTITVPYLGTNALSGYEAKTIDEKLDDNKPGLGKVYVVYTGSVNCVDSSDMAAAKYVATNEKIACMLQYNLTK